MEITLLIMENYGIKVLNFCWNPVFSITINLKMCLGAQMNHHFEMVLLSTHNIFLAKRKNVFLIMHSYLKV